MIPEHVDDVTDARNRRDLGCGKSPPDTQFARRIRAVIAEGKKRFPPSPFVPDPLFPAEMYDLGGVKR